MNKTAREIELEKKVAAGLKKYHLRINYKENHYQ